MGHELTDADAGFEAAATQAAALEALIGRSVVSIGVDVVEIDRIRRITVSRSGFVRRVYTDDESRYALAARDPAERFAARFAAKEATMKALGVGLGGVDFRDMAVSKAPSGAPSLVVSGRAAIRANELGIGGWLLTLSHSDTIAIAVVAGLAS
ncbi:MAG: holo-ACP synthase [Acidimicrobiales bacterium]